MSGPTSARASAGLFWKNADGSGSVEALEMAQNPRASNRSLTLVPDGSGVVIDEAQRSGDLFLVGLEDSGSMTALFETGVQAGRIRAERNPSISSNGRWMAYNSNESGRNEIYVRPFPNIDDGLWLVSTGGGIAPVWSQRGDELFYQAVEDRLARFDVAADMMVVPVTTDAEAFAHGAPSRLFELSTSASAGVRMFDVAPDAQRFLVTTDLSAEATRLPQINVVLNWFEELNRLVPVP